MRIAAVLDLLNRVVVRGVAGERASYRPIRSGLTCETAPLEVARAMLGALPLEVFYVADLDAIGGLEPNWNVYAALAELGGELWVDAGVSSADQARRLADFSSAGRGLDRVIVGLESLARPDELPATLEAIGPERAIFSLDMQQGRLMTSIDAWRDRPAAQVASLAVEAGFRRLIVLDLAGVGTGQGVRVVELCRRLKSEHPDLELISGGGVRHLADLRQLADAGCTTALVASALHDGRLNRADLEAAAAFTCGAGNHQARDDQDVG